MSSMHSVPEFNSGQIAETPLELDQLPPQQWPRQWQPTDRFPTPQSIGDNPFHKVAASSLSYTSHQPEYHLGEPELPIAPYRNHIVETISEHQTSVISSETGSGKSSQVGLYLLEAGFPRVWVTQPRILAARELMERARQNLGEDNARLTGYLTGNAKDSDCSPDARLIYVTEQLLFNMANRGMLKPDDVIINDEAHERTTATVLLLGLVKELLPQNPDMRLVVSSATIDTAKFSHYLTGPNKTRAPILSLPGRTFPTERRETTDSVSDAMRRLMKQGNVLAFEPGISRMRTTMSKAQSRNKDKKVHLLYGDQSPAEQAAALNPEDGNNVVASRIGETSITPGNKDGVVDSGLSNLGGYVAGVRVLETVTSSQATLLQRMGRVGRTRPGIYELATPDDAPPQPSFADRPAYDPPSIENSSVTAFIAELAAAGRRIEDLDLLERPTAENLRHDVEVLRRLGAVVLTEGGEHQLTEVGAAMTELPLDAPLARMLVEARLIDEADIDCNVLRLQVAAAVATQQVNGILDARQGGTRRYINRKGHQEVLSAEQSSDMIFGLDVFTVMYRKWRQLPENISPDAQLQFDRMLESNDVLPNRFHKAVRTYEELCRRESLESIELQKADAAHRRNIVACQIAGAEELFVQRSKQVHVDIRGDRRTLGRRSTVNGTLAGLVIGTAFDLRGLNSNGVFKRQFISAGTAVSLEQLTAGAAHRITRSSLGYGVTRKGVLVEKQALYFDQDLHFADLEADLPPTLPTRIALITAMMTGKAPSARDLTQTVPFHPGTPNAARAVGQWEEAQRLEHKSPVKLNTDKRYAGRIQKMIRKSLELIPLDVVDPQELDAIIDPVYLNSLVSPSRKARIPEIKARAQDSVKVYGGDGQALYIPARYNNRVAYVTLPREVKFSIKPSDFDEIRSYSDLKVRLANGRYQTVESLFKTIDEQREVEEAKRTRRQELREFREAAEARREGDATRRERRNADEERIETEIKRLLKAPSVSLPSQKYKKRVVQHRTAD